MKSGSKNLKGIFIFLVLIAVLTGVYAWKKPKTVKGDKDIGLTVIDDRGKEVQYFESTNAEYLRTVLDELEGQNFSYSGNESVYGYYIDTVNGVNVDNVTAYWAFYVNGKYCDYGIDNQPVSDGDMFEIIYEKVTDSGS